MIESLVAGMPNQGDPYDDCAVTGKFEGLAQGFRKRLGLASDKWDLGDSNEDLCHRCNDLSKNRHQ